MRVGFTIVAHAALACACGNAAPECVVKLTLKSKTFFNGLDLRSNSFMVFDSLP